MKFHRSAGILLNVSSLPSEYGIGCFSRDADAFIETAVDMGFHWWQILPVTTLGWGNSPYSGVSTHAGNTLYICPGELVKEGLISSEEAASFKYCGEPFSADYDFARRNSEAYTRLAFSRLDRQKRSAIESFKQKEAYWLEDYALFSALAANHGSDWRKWDKPLKFRDKKALEKARSDYAKEIDFYVFQQYEFYREWFALKERANMRGMQIIGDIPFYVGYDSCDVWANHELFQLDENLDAKLVAGVPPDAFSANGQIWGNCLYDFDAMKKDGYAWWRKRVSHCFELYNALRLDHFRAFYNYFAIPAEDKDTAARGVWLDGPKDELLGLIKNDNPQGVLIAEDLGLIDDACRCYINNCGLPTMRVFQFAFDGGKNPHLPYNYENNCVAYTGTHDNNTTLGWLYELDEPTRSYALKFCGFSGSGWGAGGPYCESVKAVIKTIMASSAGLVVIPFQDLLGYGSDTRMNIPGKAEGNWLYRLPYQQMMNVDRDFYLDIIKMYGRLGGGIKA
jgi:4-alpha-glucanotransferase